MQINAFLYCALIWRIVSFAAAEFRTRSRLAVECAGRYEGTHCQLPRTMGIILSHTSDVKHIIGLRSFLGLLSNSLIHSHSLDLLGVLDARPFNQISS